MQLRRLKINALPGIEPGFTFKPASDGVNIVTGPNAVGKSSLSRALKYLLGGVDQRGDPPNLHLEAEFLSDDIRWKVRRTGRQVTWTRNGGPATPPALPGADQFGLYRLSVESLLADDKSDRVLADELWRAVRGGYDLDAARGHLGPRFATKHERNLRARRKALANVEREYEELQDLEAELPGLARRIEDSDRATVRCKRLETALELDGAIRKRQELRIALDSFPPDMGKLHGDELDRLKDIEMKAGRLEEKTGKTQRRLAEASQNLDRTGLPDSRPDPEQLARIKSSLRRVGEYAIKRANAQDLLSQAKSSLESALAELKGGGEPPRLDANSLQRAREIMEPLVDSRSRKRELRRQLGLVGTPPNETELEQLREGANALDAWLRAKTGNGLGGGGSRASWVHATAWVAIILAGVAALAALVVGAWWAVAGTLASAMAMIVSRHLGRGGEARVAAMDAARQRFIETDLELPPEWKTRPVREHLRRTIERRLDQLRLQKERSEGAAKLRAELSEVTSVVEDLEGKKRKLAKAIGIAPELPDAPFYRFIAATDKWDLARSNHANQRASLQDVDDKISQEAASIRKFLVHWRTAEAPQFPDSTGPDELDGLRIAFDGLEARLTSANKATGIIESAQRELKSLGEQTRAAKTEIANLFGGAGLKPYARDELFQRIDQLEAWRQARDKVAEAEIEERRLRRQLGAGSLLVEAVDSGAVQDLQTELQAATVKAEEHTGLIEEQTRVKTMLETARASHKLEQSAGELDQAMEALKDKREEALLHAATEVLLDEVENAFKTEREPDLLRKARERFEQVTAHAFTLELRGKEEFAAHDREQGERRTPAQLSSGTRMQLLLALRLAWTEDRERGGESLPLFLDEALTTSDEDRFAVMAQTLSRLAEEEGRQIFYLSARRHEAALWKHSTGSTPPVIDLAAVRFAAEPMASDTPRIELPLPLPPPNGQDADNYAASIGVPVVNPRRDSGGIHIFHLLRDDLPLLYRLMETWRVISVGQLESLLVSDAAGSAVSNEKIKRRLLLRCHTARSWAELWLQGRGRPVDRVVMDQCPAVSDIFLDRAADLARELNGDARAFLGAVQKGKLKGFYASKTNELDEWLVDMGFIDDADVLEYEERRRLTLQYVAASTETDAEDVNRVIDWLESGVAR